MNRWTFSRATLIALLGLAAACACAPSVAKRPASGPAPAERPATPAVTGFGFTVRDLDASVAFFTDVLGAEVVARRSAEGPELDALTGLAGAKAQAVIVRVGAERVTLTRYAMAGRSARADAVSNDLDFQHLALVVRDIDAAHERVMAADVRAVSRGGPQRIPDTNVAAAGIRAFYFRDREAHPLELIWFPADKGEDRWHASSGPVVLGIDHSAIAVSSTESSLRFYRDLLGLRVAGESLNEGIEQERLSAVDGARVRIVGLRGRGGPGVEFLQYLSPGPGRARPEDGTPRDLFYWETTIAVADLDAARAALADAGVPQLSRRPAVCGLCFDEARALLVSDPDGHTIRLIER